MLENYNRGGYEIKMLNWGQIIQVLLMSEIVVIYKEVDMKFIEMNNVFKE